MKGRVRDEGERIDEKGVQTEVGGTIYVVKITRSGTNLVNQRARGNAMRCATHAHDTQSAQGTQHAWYVPSLLTPLIGLLFSHKRSHLW